MSEVWASWLRFAVLNLGLTPEAFWSLTLSEWIALTRQKSPVQPLGRSELEALLRAYPDLSKSRVEE